jgi:hypothetical protein
MDKVEKQLIESLQEQSKNNSIIKFAVADNRDYVTPEDVTAAIEAGIDINLIRKDALECLAGYSGYGVEDKKLFAYVAWDEK